MANNIAEEPTKYEVENSANVHDNNYIILSSKGVNTVGGHKVLRNALTKCFGRRYELALKDKKILVCFGSSCTCCVATYINCMLEKY